MAIWGIDLGGTKIEGVIIESLINPEVILRHRIPTESNQGYGHILDRVKVLVSEMESRTGLHPDAIGFGTPGALDPQSNTMKNCNTVTLNGKPLKDDLENKLEVPVKLANDANCFALAETVMGSVHGQVPTAQVTFGVIMGTGVGGGMVIDRKVHVGKHGIAGEWGHNFLDESGGPCYCGKVGCVETILSGTALEHYYEVQSGQCRKLKEIYMAYQENNDMAATMTINRLIHFFGKGMATVINVLDPDAIVLGGGVGNIDLLYTEGVKEVKKYVFNPHLETRFLKPSLGDSAGVFGAALLIT